MTPLPPGLILYGPPGSGKDTITAALRDANPRFRLFERLKAGPGRTTGYRLTTAEHIEHLAQSGELLYRNRRYEAEYAIDRAGVRELAEQNFIPVLHMGQVAGAQAVTTFPLHWVRGLLWCPLSTTESRSTDRGDKDVDARLKVWHETREDLLTHPTEPWTLTLRTDRLTPLEAGQAITEAVSAGAFAEQRDIEEFIA